MPSQVTFTGSVGPGLEATSLVLTGVTSFKPDIPGNTVEITQGSKTQIYSLEGVTTFTISISGSSWTIVIS